MQPVTQSKLTLAGLKSAYRNKQNIMRLVREMYGHTTNDQFAILAAYDLQAGSYIKALNNPATAAALSEYTAAVAAILDGLQPMSLLEAGVGEATTLVETVRQLSTLQDRPVLGFDLSWSRIHVARQYWRAHNTQPVHLFVGELEAIPLLDAAVDVVFTSHAIEPNHGREREILRELVRVAGRYVVLFEPAYEFASREAQTHMEAHGYCRGLRQVAEQEGCRVVEHRLLGVNTNKMNPTAVLVLEKDSHPGLACPGEFACPVCRSKLVAAEDGYYCETEGLVFPILRGIPCLSRSNGVIASHYLR